MLNRAKSFFFVLFACLLASTSSAFAPLQQFTVKTDNHGVSNLESSSRRAGTTTSLFATGDKNEDEKLISLQLAPDFQPTTAAGAAFGTIVISTVLFHNPLSVTAALTPAAAYLSLTQGTVGSTLRVLGNFGWNIVTLIFDLVSKALQNAPEVATDVVDTSKEEAAIEKRQREFEENRKELARKLAAEEAEKQKEEEAESFTKPLPLDREEPVAIQEVQQQSPSTYTYDTVQGLLEIRLYYRRKMLEAAAEEAMLAEETKRVTEAMYAEQERIKQEYLEKKELEMRKEEAARALLEARLKMPKAAPVKVSKKPVKEVSKKPVKEVSQKPVKEVSKKTVKVVSPSSSWPTEETSRNLLQARVKMESSSRKKIMPSSSSSWPTEQTSRNLLQARVQMESSSRKKVSKSKDDVGVKVVSPVSAEQTARNLLQARLQMEAASKK